MLLKRCRPVESRTLTDPFVKLSLDEAGRDAADRVAVAGDVRSAQGESGRFSREPRLQVQVNGPLEVPLPLLHLSGLFVLSGLRQPGQVTPTEAVQLRVALGQGQRQLSLKVQHNTFAILLTFEIVSLDV